MTTAFFYDDRFLDHDTGHGHPERADRLRAIVRTLRESGLWNRLRHLPFEPMSVGEIARLHAPAYIDRLRDACWNGLPHIDMEDSTICHATYEIARLAAGAGAAAVDAVMAGTVRNAFCAVRPPGHHAEREHSMGFCMFNNIALAADRLIRKHGLERVAIVDFDVHHGNGTQHLFENRSDVFFASIHEDPNTLYPGTGFEQERGQGDGEGMTLNICMAPRSNDAAYLRAFDERIIPALRAYAPQFVLVSAGFDAAESDPLAHQLVTSEGFHQIARRLFEFDDGRLVAMLEGGYDLQALSEGVRVFIETLL